MTVAGTAMTLPRRNGVRGMRALPGSWQEARGRCLCTRAGVCTQIPPPTPRQGPNSQGRGQAAPQRPDALVARDLHEGILGREQSAGRGASTPPANTLTPSLGQGDLCPPCLHLQPLPACR